MLLQQIGTLVFVAGAIVVGAMADAYNDKSDATKGTKVADKKLKKSNKTIGHALEVGEKALLLTAPFILDLERSDWLTYGASYLFLRVALFDVVYNLTRKLPINYSGVSSWWDKIMSKMPGFGKWTYRVLFAITGVALIFKSI